MDDDPRRRRRTSQRSWARWSRVLSLVLAVLLGAPVAMGSAAPAKVALVHELDPNPLQLKALTRLRAELVAAGFEVSDIERRSDDPRDAAEADPIAAGVFATIAISPRTGDAADVRIADKLTGKAVVRRIQAPPGAGRDVASILAVRTVELLQASLLEALEPTTREKPTAAQTSDAPPEAPRPTDASVSMEARPSEESAAPPEARFALSAGGGVLHSFAGIGPAFLPVVGFSYRLSTTVTVGVRGGGPALASDLAATGGTIAVRQELAMLHVAYEPLPDTAVRPRVVIGAGAYHLHIAGAAEPPYRGESDGRFAAILAAGPGARLRVASRVSLVTDVRLLIVAPRPVVRAGGEEVASVSRPSLLGEAAIDVAF